MYNSLLKKCIKKRPSVSVEKGVKTNTWQYCLAQNSHVPKEVVADANTNGILKRLN